jgi:hypothetical protein
MLLVFALLLIPFFVILNGWYLSVLWQWLMVPAFQVQPLSIPVCIAIAMIIQAFHPAKTDDLEGAKNLSAGGKLVYACFMALGKVAFGLLCAYILKHYI